jgi:glycosyltransferase involved in cell wall biosynthesis
MSSPCTHDREADVAAPHDVCDSVVFWGNVDWWYHNRGHSTTRIATRIARRVPTLWVNSIAMRLPVPGRTEISFQRYARKLRSLCKGLQRDPDSGMWVYSPRFLPRYTPGGLEFNGKYVARQVTRVLQKLNLHHPAAWIAMPTIAPAVQRMTWRTTVFDRCDDFAAFPEADHDLVVEMENRLLQLCDHAAYVNTELFERERDKVAQAHLLGHGVDFARFANARPVDRALPEPPAPLRDLPKPLVGFYGGLDDYRMDLPLMIAIARHIAPATLVLIGPKQMDLRKLLAEPNVKWVNQLPPQELPIYAAHFDVGIIPFLVNDFNLRCTPVKLKEYLALGYPTVAMRLPAFEPYNELIHLADSHEAFLASLDAALQEPDRITRTQQRRDAVKSHSWDLIADRAAVMLRVPLPE